MAKPETRGLKKDDHDKHEADDVCILCEAIIEISDHQVYFATGHCRYCHEVLEEE
jgi:hypothetical protein